jgi:hypothetical protein
VQHDELGARFDAIEARRKANAPKPAKLVRDMTPHEKAKRAEAKKLAARREAAIIEMRRNGYKLDAAPSKTATDYEQARYRRYLDDQADRFLRARATSAQHEKAINKTVTDNNPGRTAKDLDK